MIRVIIDKRDNSFVECEDERGNSLSAYTEELGNNLMAIIPKEREEKPTQCKCGSFHFVLERFKYPSTQTTFGKGGSELKDECFDIGYKISCANCNRCYERVERYERREARNCLKIQK